jgi:hypothetical protein
MIALKGIRLRNKAPQNDFFEVSFPRPIKSKPADTGGKQPKLQQELQPKLQQELQQESLYSIVLYKLLTSAKSRKEISVELGQKSISGQLNEIIAKLYENNLIARTIPEKPNSPKQKYKLTDRGRAFCSLINRSEGE